MSDVNSVKDSIDVEEFKRTFKQRKQFAIHADTALVLEQFTAELEDELSVNLTHSDTIYSVLTALKARTDEEVMIVIYATALAHKTIRFNIDSVTNKKELFELIDRVTRNRELFIEIYKYAEAFKHYSDDIEYLQKRAKEVIDLIEKCEDSLFKDFEIAIVNIFKKSLAGKFNEVNRIKDIKKLKKFLLMLSENKIKMKSRTKQKTTTDISKLLEELMRDSKVVLKQEETELKNSEVSKSD